MKKAFMLLLIVLMISLLLNHFFSWTVKENFSDSGDSESTSSMPGSIQVDINSGQHNLVYQNAGEIKQQEKTITDFQSSAENAIKDLSDRVTAFQKVISKNTTDISNNAVAIRSTTRQIKSAAAAKEQKMNKAAGDMNTKK